MLSFSRSLVSIIFRLRYSYYLISLSSCCFSDRPINMRQEAFCFDIFHQITSLVSFAQSLKSFVKFTWRCYFFFTLLGNKTHPSEPSHVELHWQEKRVLSLAMFHFWEQSGPYFGHNLKQKLWIISNCNRVPTILLDRPQEHWNFLHNHSSFITTSGKDQLVITQCPFRNEKFFKKSWIHW